VDELTRSLDGAFDSAGGPLPHDLLVDVARDVIAEARAAALSGGIAGEHDTLVARARALLTVRRKSALRRVINATGVIINTNLGRAPLSEAALVAMAEVARGYSNLEYDLDKGERGSRHTHVRTLLRGLTGAEDALVMNNNAAAMLVVLSALAAGRDVVVSRGELVEIGGGFRVPDVMRQGGARLVEVGTTNRTRVRDYEEAITDATALLLAVHPSNFRVVGFTEAPELAELADLAHRHNLPLVYDLGSGSLLTTDRWGLAPEPTVQHSVGAGADIVCFSGDKLLGGPQAGIVAGRSALLAHIARHPLMRAVRIDKLTLAALAATLRHYRDGEAERTIPVWQAISMPVETIRVRAECWAEAVHTWGVPAATLPGESTIGGGSLPGETLATVLCGIGENGGSLDLDALAARLRAGEPPVVARIARGRLLLDPRTVRPDEDDILVAALRTALGR
jgi:L-seryl-tRNA(Ser) seleniumtransferase